jgi:putative nucleotidyltransferase with HDIG domain
MDMNEWFDGETQIPSLPTIYYDFRSAVNELDTSFEEIGQIIGQDPGLTAKLLKIVNSAYFGFDSQVETISHAIGIIGIEQLNDMVLSTVVMNQFKNVPSEALEMESFWKHSIACAIASKILAIEMGVENPERIFVAALMHDIGRLIICNKASFETLKIFFVMKNKNVELCSAERDVLGFDHAELGGKILENWNLPDFHQEIIRFHHIPSMAPNYMIEASIIHVADILMNTLELGDSGETVIQEFDFKAKRLTGIENESMYYKIIKETEEKLDDAFRIFFHCV